MTRSAGDLDLASLAARHPEWEAWLALFGLAREAVDDPAWMAAVPPAPATSDETRPLIAGAMFTIDPRLAGRLLGPLLRRIDLPDVDEGAMPAVLEAAIAEDVERLGALSATIGADAQRFATAAALAVMPLLQACRRAWWERVPVSWMAASCPVCGAWATLAEARGLENKLALRCGRCGADWAAQVLRCAFCGNTDHERLRTLVADVAGDTRKVEVCDACHGYTKTITTLTACPPPDVRLLDLATVDLDVAALSQGYTRPECQAHRLDVRVVAAPPRGLLARWRR